MEIDFCNLNWQKRVWFLVKISLVLTVMRPVASTSIRHVLSSSEHPPEKVPLNASRPSLVITQAIALKGPTILEEPKEDDPELDTEDECQMILSLETDSDFGEEECDYFYESFPPPPDFEFLPPPPLPPFLKEIEDMFRASRRRSPNLVLSYSEERKALIEYESERILPIEDGSCPLCQWSRGNNETLALFSNQFEQGAEEERNSESLTIWILVGVALISASVGAVAMGLFLKCRRKDVVNICSKESTDLNSNTREATAVAAEEEKPKSSGLRSIFRNWRQASTKSSLDPYRAESIQNTYSESPYINTDSSSTLYAEINTPPFVDSPRVAAQSSQSKSYSEVPDPPVTNLGLNMLRSKMGRMRSDKDGGNSKNTYVVSEVSSEPNESSGGSTSTPSSAYYSDVSSPIEVQMNKKKKKKRKSNEKIMNLKCSSGSAFKNESVSDPQSSSCIHSGQVPCNQTIHPPRDNAFYPTNLGIEVSCCTNIQPLPSMVPALENPSSFLNDNVGVPSIQPGQNHRVIFSPVENNMSLSIQPHLNMVSLQPQANMIPLQPQGNIIHFQHQPNLSPLEAPTNTFPLETNQAKLSMKGQQNAPPLSSLPIQQHVQHLPVHAHLNRVPVCPHLQAIECVVPEEESQKPLPPLPSRKFQGPKRKPTANYPEQSLSAMPSEYI